MSDSDALAHFLLCSWCGAGQPGCNDHVLHSTLVDDPEGRRLDEVELDFCLFLAPVLTMVVILGMALP